MLLAGGLRCITAGQASEYDQAAELVEGINAVYALADKGYDNDQLIDLVEATGAPAARRNRKKQRMYDRALYQERNLVERFFQKLKEFRRIATCYEKLKRNYQAMLDLASSIILLA